MKKSLIYIFIILFATGLTSCFTDKGNYNYTALEEVTISGIDPSYTKLALTDRIQISPTVTASDKNAKLEYFWAIYNPAGAGYESSGQLDTIAKTKDLDYPVNLPARTWGLLFGVKNSTTGYTKLKEVTLNVTTQFTRGWFVL